MKKYVMLICAMFCLWLAGCGAAESETSQRPQEDTWSYALTVHEEKGEAKADDGRVVATYRYQVPEMTTAAGTPSAEETAAMDAFNDYFAGWLTNGRLGEFEWLADGAREDYAMVLDKNGKPQEDSFWNDQAYAYVSETDTAFWDNGRLLCVSLSNYLFSGGAHGNGVRGAELFDLRNGKHIVWQELMADQEGLNKAVISQMLDQAQKLLEQGEEGTTLYEDYADSLQEWTDRTVLFDQNGMSVIYAPYDIAPYAAGEQVFTIPYEIITPYLNDYGREVLELS